MTAALLVAREGRPPSTTSGLRRALDAEILRHERTALELQALQVESRAFAERVRIRVDRIKNLVAIGADMAAINEAGRVGYDADRRLEQLGSVVL